jgi:hypothetical protein
MNTVALVFRSVGERTSQIAFDLALKQVSPNEVHLVQNIRPFVRAVQFMLSLSFKCDYVVFVDADCLILEDLRPFLLKDTLAFVNCQGLDKFRGQAVAGVHITRIDVIQAMQNIHPLENDREYVLRPETKLRDLALKQIGATVDEQRFAILHDYFQYYRDIFTKYTIRELRSRSPQKRARFDGIMRNWPINDPDFVVAKQAVAYARSHLQLGCTPAETEAFIEKLPEVAGDQLDVLGLHEKNVFAEHELTCLREWPR